MEIMAFIYQSVLCTRRVDVYVYIFDFHRNVSVSKYAFDAFYSKTSSR